MAYQEFNPFLSMDSMSFDSFSQPEPVDQIFASLVTDPVSVPGPVDIDSLVVPDIDIESEDVFPSSPSFEFAEFEFFKNEVKTESLFEPEIFPNKLPVTAVPVRGPVVEMGPSGLQLVRRHSDGNSSDSGSDYSVPFVPSRSQKAQKRNCAHRLTPLPKNWSEELLFMPTKDLNVYLKANFSPEEIHELKLCRRRIKNRGYTRQSRQRKNLPVDGCESS